MAKAKQYRWVCPECGVGKLAGKSPRRNATARYCLSCSGHSEVLVERTCPALDKQRGLRSERAKVKREGKAKRDYDRKWVHAGMDIKKESARIWKIACKLDHMLSKRYPHGPTYKIKRRKAETWPDGTVCSQASSGHAQYWSGEITLTLGVNRQDVWHVLIHEIAHLLAHVRGAGGGYDQKTKAHGDIFRAAEKELQDEVGWTDFANGIRHRVVTKEVTT